MVTTIDKLSLIHIEGRKVLFARSYGKTLFYTPGGKRESGESDIDALVREIKEELGVDLIADTLTYLHTFTGPADGKVDMLVQITCYRGDFIGALSPSNEIEELAWFTIADGDRTSPTGVMVLTWLRDQDLID